MGERSEVTEKSEKTQENIEITKQFYRKKVWDYLEKNRLALFPRPAYGRIPNFKESEQAAARLLDLEEFKSAKTIEVNPDKALENVRILVLQSNKQLYVPLPGVGNVVLKHLTVPENSERNAIRQTVSRWGIENSGTAVDINDDIHIDLLVVGSVAVSKDGYRIGKGKGYADLEFAILKEMKAIDDNTAIATIVHDSQVFDTLPKEIFGEHDVPVDYILTPTQTIKMEPKLARPKGVIWNILSQRDLGQIAVLQKLKEKHTSEGRDTTLKEVDTNKEGGIKKYRRFRRLSRRRRRSVSKTSESEAVSGDDQAKQKPVPRRRRFFRRTRSYKRESATTNGDSHAENAENIPPKRQSRKPYRNYDIDFSLMVSNIEKNVRIRDLKNALNEHGIKPNDITWRGYRGFCYLHYAKPNAKKPKEPYAVDNVIEILQTLKISPESTTVLNVKIMEPITRIETTDVTAV